MIDNIQRSITSCASTFAAVFNRYQERIEKIRAVWNAKPCFEDLREEAFTKLTEKLESRINRIAEGLDPPLRRGKAIHQNRSIDLELAGNEYIYAKTENDATLIKNAEERLKTEIGKLIPDSKKYSRTKIKERIDGIKNLNPYSLKSLIDQFNLNQPKFVR